MAWTVDQQNAIDAHGGNILVSAAAGSGKTSVLTERVVKMLTDEKNGIDASQLLAVTFTNAAASEMRARIIKALRERLKSEPGNARVKRQLLMLPAAEICTIDAFCSRLVRENFNLAGVAPDYTLLTANEQTVLESRTADEVAEKLYDGGSEGFLRLAGLLTQDGNDKSIPELIQKLYSFSESYPYPLKWLSSLSEMYNPSQPFEESVWYGVLSHEINNILEDARESYNRALSASCGDEDVKESYADALAGDVSFCTNMSELLENGKWDSLLDGICAFSPEAVRGRKGDAAVRSLTAMFRKAARESVDRAKKLACDLPSLSEHRQDCEYLYPAVSALVEAVREYAHILDSRKAEQNKYGFSDILHFAIKLLVTDGGEKTELACSLSECYREILVDEYQDTNRAQECLFNAISGDRCDIFSVGDVKQSIYGFRQAMPELFTEKKDAWAQYNPALPVFPCSISLKNNFRSRGGITAAVNYVFSRIMSREAGGVDYAGEELAASADYSEKVTPDADFVILDAGFGSSTDERTAGEAQYAAQLIKKTIEQGATVGVRGKERPVTAGDFAILLRKKTGFKAYSDALSAVGIDSVAELSVPFFTTKEISFVMSLLRVINNPLLDVPLAAVLYSDIFGFTADELSDMRLSTPRGRLYSGLLTAASSGSEKARSFLKRLDMYRSLASSGDIMKLIDCIYDDTAVFAFAAAWSNGEQRRRNLLVFKEYAFSYGSDTTGSLSGFVRYLQAIEKCGGAGSGASADSPTDRVHIVSIHKSKGLEYPYVILGGLDKDIYVNDNTTYTFERKCGLGFKILDAGKFCRYKTAPFIAAKTSARSADTSEELRVLYVAMTRAREHLTMLYTVSGGLSNALLARTAVASQHLTAGRVRNAATFGELLLTAFCTHPDAEIIRDELNIKVNITPAQAGMRFMYDSVPEVFGEEKKRFARTAPVDGELLSVLRARTEYTYPHDGLRAALAKRTASSFAEAEGEDVFFAERKPAFITEKLTGGKRGTAVHRYLELCDFKAAAASPESEGARLLSDGKMTDEELSAVDYSAIKSFFASSLGLRILSSPEVLREYEFTVALDAGEVYKQLSGADAREKIMVDGKLDCAFLENGAYVVVDYKTDRVKSSEELIARYSGQLELYKTALEMCSGVRVSGAEIFSLELSESICV